MLFAGVISYCTQGLNPIQVRQYMARGALGKHAFQGSLATVAPGSASVYFFMNYLVLPLSAVAAGTIHLGLFLSGVIGHARFVGLPISLFARRAQ